MKSIGSANPNRIPRRIGVVSRACRGTYRPIAVLVHLVLVLLLLGLALSCNSWGAEARFFRILGPASTTITITGIAPDGTVTWTNSEVGVTCIVQAAESLRSPTNWNDYVQVPVTNLVTSHRFFDPNPSQDMAYIPAGSFTIGDTFNEDYRSEIPTHTVYVSAFYMDKYEVTKLLWDSVYTWATNNGYSFENNATGKALNHPAQSMTWYDALKWSNARSEKEGKQPAYFTDEGMTIIYRNGQATNPYVRWDRGYRLPTEAEWEKAARGGLSGKRFPWGADTIAHNQANYRSIWSGGKPDYGYDVNEMPGYHPTYNDGTMPYTSPVGSFSANGYGLYDMAGNVAEWCWDWWVTGYLSSPATDPRGPTMGSSRSIRGGGWSYAPWTCRTSGRNFIFPTYKDYGLGFRTVLPPSQ